MRWESDSETLLGGQPARPKEDRRNTEATPKQPRTPNPRVPRGDEEGRRARATLGGVRPCAGRTPTKRAPPARPSDPPKNRNKRGVSFFIVVVWPTISTAAGQANSRKKPLYGRTGTSPSPRCGSLHDPTTASDKDKHRPATETTPLETPRDSQQNPTKGGHTTTPPHKKPHPPRRASKRPERLSAPSTATHPHPWRHQKPVNGVPPLVPSSRDPTLTRGRSRGGRGA